MEHDQKLNPTNLVICAKETKYYFTLFKNLNILLFLFHEHCSFFNPFKITILKALGNCFNT
jgi:hypothetical protein